AGPARVSPAIGWIRRWGISIASLIGGLLTLFVFRRGLPNVGWIVGYLLLLWLLFAVLTQLRQALEARARLVVVAADYTIQTLYHGLLLFVLPAYYASATVTSVNIGFVAVLAALALLATFDPWWQALVHPRPWVVYVFFVVAIFAALNVALPLVGMPPYAALVLSAFLSVVALTPVVRRARELAWPIAARFTVAAAILAASLAALGRAWVPPVPLTLAGASLAWATASVESLEPEPSRIPAGELHERGLTAYTAIYAPAGLRQPIEHIWRQEGVIINVVRLSPVLGGRREGFRTYSRKTEFPADPRGWWSIDVVTASGQLIGRLRFHVA
ncbi:MAG: DUF5924 family protein, partial [Candidatus Rokuibacteriota bacterium]